ncbi:MAG TPA: hypothetical protein VGA06_02580 [Candidatus Paceibacterota bacterium]
MDNEESWRITGLLGQVRRQNELLEKLIQSVLSYMADPSASTDEDIKEFEARFERLKKGHERYAKSLAEITDGVGEGA